MKIRELYKYLHDLEVNKPDPEEIAENFTEVVTESLKTYTEMICYVDILNRGTEEFKYFNNLHAYILKNLDNKKYTEFKDELVNNTDLLGDTTEWTKKVVMRRKEYGFNLEIIPGGLVDLILK